jgi:hypothetical protein
MAQRVKGQEVRITLTSPDGTEDSVGQGGISSAEIEFKTEVLSEGYLGEATERKDDIFRGVSGRLEFHLDRQSWFSLVDKIVARSQRRDATSGTAVFNVILTLSFPSGERPRVLLENVFFGPLPTRIGGRDEYVTASIDFECSGGRFLL